MSAPLDDASKGFARMLKESLAGMSFDPAPGREALEAGLREFERRERALRLLAWGTVGAMALLAAWAAWSFLSAPADAGVKRLVLDATLFLWASLGIAFGKLWLFTTQAQLATQRELKRLELALLDARKGGA
jgi:hypothetical protein